MQQESQLDPIRAWQAGSLQAAHMLVRRHQSEIRGIAYLLTLDQDQGRGLAHATFEQFFQSISTLDPDSDPRLALLTRLGRSFLRKEFEAEDPSPVAFMATAMPQKYGVENQRDRVMAALGRMDERERVALVLGEVAGFDPGQLNTVLERGNTALVAPMETGRQRLRQSLDIPMGNPVRPVLLDAMFDGPQEDIWPAIEDNVAEIQRGEQRRGQLLTWGIAAGVVLILLVGIIALFDVNPFSGDDADSPGIGSELPIDDEDLGTPAPTVVPPTPTPIPTPLPAADLPNLLIAAELDRQTATYYRAQIVQYDAETNQIVQVGESAATEMMQNAAFSSISPDGGSLIVAATAEPLAENMYRLMVFDIDTFELRWEMTLTIDQTQAGFGWIASSSDAIYLAQFDPESDMPVVTAYALEDGTETGSATLEYSVSPDQQAVVHSLHLHVAPDESFLLATLYRFPWLGGSENEAWYGLVRLPDLEPAQMLQVETPEDGPRFDFRRARMTIDGDALYFLDYGIRGHGLVVQFFRLADQQHTAVEIPFSLDGELPYSSNAVTSNDGRRLYLYDSTVGEIAIVNLDEQRLERFFPLDTGAFEDLFGKGEGQFGMGWPSLLSLDGERLYIGARFNPDAGTTTVVESTGIWVIDVNTWTVADFWPVDGVIDTLYHVPGSDSLLVRSQMFPPPEGTGSTVSNVATFARVGRVDGEVVFDPVDSSFAESIDSYFQLGSLTQLYAAYNGRAAGIDGIMPADPLFQSSLPGIRLWAPLNVVSNQDAQLTVRILDPATRRALEAARDEVRFDPASTITARLSREGSPSQLVVLNTIEPGLYRGNINLPDHGSWNVDISIISPDGTTRLIPAAGNIVIQPTLTGDDGKRYRARLTYEPGDPAANQQIIVRVRLVDVETGEMLPEGLGFSGAQDVLDGAALDPLPDRLYVTFGAPGYNLNPQTLVVNLVEHGVWMRNMTFWTDGTWSSSVQVQLGPEETFELFTGTVGIDPAAP